MYLVRAEDGTFQIRKANKNHTRIIKDLHGSVKYMYYSFFYSKHSQPQLWYKIRIISQYIQISLMISNISYNIHIYDIILKILV